MRTSCHKQVRATSQHLMRQSVIAFQTYLVVVVMAVEEWLLLEYLQHQQQHKAAQVAQIKPQHVRDTETHTHTIPEFKTHRKL